MNIKLKEIADLAGVSVSTVSRALNNSPLISESTRQKVREVARKLNYQTDQMSLIGVIVPKITNPLFGEIVTTIASRAYAAGYGMILCDSAFDLDRERDQINYLLRQNGVMGMILIPIDPEVEQVLQLAGQNMPCVILGTVPILGIDQVNVDAVMGARAITRYLIELGHQRIGLIQGPSRVAACRSRLKGYCQALEDFHLPFDPSLVAEAQVDENGGAEAMGMLLPRVGREISAVVAISDAMALGALRCLREAGVRVPEDLSLAGCDDIPVAEQVEPALTTVWQPKRELGELAARFLLKQIDRRKELGDTWKLMYPFQGTMYFPHVIVRKSTMRPA